MISLFFYRQKALNGIRTHDLILTKNALYRLSYEGSRSDWKRGLPDMDGDGFEPTKACAN
jgi:hypothetical protein